MISPLKLELALFAKDRALQFALFILAGLLVGSVFIGDQSQQKQRAAFKEAAERIHFEWQNQPPRNPHEAAHYGLFVYRADAPLGPVSSGVLAHQGASVFLEAHRRNEPYLAPAAMRMASTGLTTEKMLPILNLAGGLTALIIGLLIGGRDQRRRTAPLLMSVDSRQNRLTAQAVFVLGLMLAVSAAATIAGLVSIGVNANGLRLGLTMVFGMIHLSAMAVLGIVGGATIGGRAGGVATIALLWGLGAIAAPRLLGLVGETVIPTTQLEFETRLNDDLSQVINAHGESEENEAFKHRILDRYGVSSVEELPVNYDALLMQEDEYQRAPIYEQRLIATAERINAQDAVRAVSWLFSPTPAMMEASSRLAGTHIDAQRAFDRAAEAYRLETVERLNLYMAENSSTGDWAWTAGSDFYQSFGAFEPPTTPLAIDLRAATLPIIAMLGWLIVSLIGLRAVARSVS